MTEGAVVVVGGTSGLGKEVARYYVGADREVVITGRDPTREELVAAELGGKTTELAFDLSKPEEIAPALKGVGAVSRLVLAGVHRDENSMGEYDIGQAVALVTLKLVGYEVVHALLDRLHDDSSVLIFGGLAKERLYPGSMTVTTINHGVDGLVRSLTAELKPIRVNALHAGIVEDSPYWAGKTAVLDAHRARTTTGRLVQMQDIVDVAVLMLENPRSPGPSSASTPAGRSRSEDMTIVGLLGAGRMGGAMVRTLRGAGFDVVVWNREAAKAHALADSHGAKVAGTASEAAAADVAITSLADDAAVEAVYADAAEGFHPGQVVLEMARSRPRPFGRWNRSSASAGRRCSTRRSPAACRWSSGASC